MSKALGSYLYLAALAAIVGLLNIGFLDYSQAHTDPVSDVVFLAALGALLTVPAVRIEHGRLTLSGIAVVAASLVLNPLNATLVGIGTSVSVLRRGALAIIGNAVVTGSIAFCGSVVATGFRVNASLSTPARLLVVGTCVLVNISIVGVIFRHQLERSLRTVSVALSYMGLAGLVISYLIDGSLRGYFLASVVAVLALALTDTIAGRRIRQVLESELSDADRHLFHSRAVEGVVHNVRNHIASAVGYLKEIEVSRLDPVDREAVETASAAANDAAAVLRTLSQGATPRVSYSPAPIDLNELALRGLGMARPRAKTKEIELGLRQSPDEVKVRADPLLLREVISNLINNAIDAAPTRGHVEVSTGRRNNGWPFLSVADNGPGVSDENRHHLFEPHFTTKEGGTGLGLFMSYGTVKEHQGQLMYEGGRRGAVFTVTLPPFGG